MHDKANHTMPVRHRALIFAQVPPQPEPGYVPEPPRHTPEPTPVGDPTPSVPSREEPDVLDPTPSPQTPPMVAETFA